MHDLGDVKFEKQVAVGGGEGIVGRCLQTAFYEKFH